VTRSARNHLFTIAEMLAACLSSQVALVLLISMPLVQCRVPVAAEQDCRADLTVARRERLRWRHPSLARAELAL
jgi:hypothetical protein